jgi:lipopolysaccharide transport system ATP-binding protein
VTAFESLGKKDTVMIAHAIFICRLAPGDYFISLGIATQQNDEVIPHDRRYDAIHLQVSPVTAFFGLCDLQLELTVQEIA